MRQHLRFGTVGPAELDETISNPAHPAQLISKKIFEFQSANPSSSPSSFSH
ncbi:hypothetical protein PGT21_000587 [Puccinia graminis f. sp. tritici]|uniref:Uncharacterized protein n=1 Tax=Puccinia graminis f. sp. tritici TaxID=56615 RepID=A0A5B0P6F2_PUCGR|nr:hypothetical protein PGT21_000587 [Puccinia graminis f. sp. tritici]